jgi:hypothetical protein
MSQLMVVAVGVVGFAVFFGLIGLHARRRLRELSDDPPLYLVTSKPNRTFTKPWRMAGELIAKSGDIPPDDPPLNVGEDCVFISWTGPVMMVVDANDTHVITSWDEGMQEHKFPRRLVRRWAPDELVKVPA